MEIWEKKIFISVLRIKYYKNDLIISYCTDIPLAVLSNFQRIVGHLLGGAFAKVLPSLFPWEGVFSS